MVVTLYFLVVLVYCAVVIVSVQMTFSLGFPGWEGYQLVELVLAQDCCCEDSEH